MPTVLHTPQLIRSGVANDTGRLRPTLPHTLEAALSISGSMIDELMVGLAPACDPDRQGPLPLGLELLDESLVEQLMADADALKRDWHRQLRQVLYHGQGAEALVMGRPEDEATGMGPLISAEHKQKVMGYYAKAKAEGATVITGGGEPAMTGEYANGHFVQPTIWTGLPESASVIREEIFGPCCHIAPFDTEEEAIALANATDYGLATTVWTQNLGTAHRMAAAIEVGLCWINSWFLRDLRTAFGGAKASGIGREGGVHSLEFYTELRNVMVKL